MLIVLMALKYVPAMFFTLFHMDWLAVAALTAAEADMPHRQPHDQPNYFQDRAGFPTRHHLSSVSRDFRPSTYE
jgi:hypothetical protein